VATIKPVEPDFGITQANREGIWLVVVRGYIGNDECERLMGVLAHLVSERCPRVIVDAYAVTFLTVATLTRLSVAARTIRGMNGEFRLAGLSGTAAGLAKLARLERKLELEPDLATAIRSLSLVNHAAPGRRGQAQGTRAVRTATDAGETHDLEIQPS